MLLEMSVLGILFATLTTGVPPSPGEPIRTAVRALLASHQPQPGRRPGTSA
jgi:hypothetical protein